MTLTIVPSQIPERIALPDVRRLDQMPSWPAWVDLRVASMKDECQPRLADGKYMTIPTLPGNLTLTAGQRAEIERHLCELDKLAEQTPIKSAAWEGQTLILITKLMMDRPSQQQGDAGAEASGEAFQDALDDIPTFAVRRAIKRFNRGDWGLDQFGKPYDYHWRPDPAALRRIAYVEAWRTIGGPAQTLRRLLAAEPLMFDDEHTANMRTKLATIPGVERPGD